MMDTENFYNLTTKQKVFCHEYLKDLNSTQAAIRAGYSKKTARIIATQNLSKLNIKMYLAVLLEKRFEECNLSTEKVISEYMKIAFSDITEYLENDENENIRLNH